MLLMPMMTIIIMMFVDEHFKSLAACPPGCQITEDEWSVRSLETCVFRIIRKSSHPCTNRLAVKLYTIYYVAEKLDSNILKLWSWVKNTTHMYLGMEQKIGCYESTTLLDNFNCDYLQLF